MKSAVGLHPLSVDRGAMMAAAGKVVWHDIPFGTRSLRRCFERAVEALENYRATTDASP